jgi:hypothetical protein
VKTMAYILENPPPPPKPIINDPEALYEAMRLRGGLRPDKMCRGYCRETLKSLGVTHELSPHMCSRLKARIRFYQFILDQLSETGQ